MYKEVTAAFLYLRRKILRVGIKNGFFTRDQEFIISDISRFRCKKIYSCSMYNTYKIHSCFAIATKLAPAYGKSSRIFPPLFFISLQRRTLMQLGLFSLEQKGVTCPPLSTHSPTPPSPYLITAFYVVIRRMEYPRHLLFRHIVFKAHRAISHHFPWYMISLKISINYYTGHVPYYTFG